MTDKWDSMSGCSWSRANRLYLTPVTAPVSPSQPCQIRGTCAGSPPQAIDSHTLPWGSCQEAKEAAAEGGFPISAVAPTPVLCMAQFWVSPQNPNSFVSKRLRRARGCWKLCVQAAGREAGAGMVPLTCASFPRTNITLCCQTGFHPFLWAQLCS